MTPESRENIKTSFAALEPRAGELTGLFYAKLFAAYPGVRPLFPEDVKPQSAKLAASLAAVVANIDDLSVVVPTLKAMGKRHVGYGAEPAHYGAVRDTLLEAMAELAGDLWNDTLQQDWTTAINLVADVMLQGASEA